MDTNTIDLVKISETVRQLEDQIAWAKEHDLHTLAYAYQAGIDALMTLLK